MNTQKQALLVIDAQNIYTTEGSPLFCRKSERTIQNINRLIESFERSDQPIIFIRHCHAPDGSDLGRMFDFAGPSEDFNFKLGSQEVGYTAQLRHPPKLFEVMKSRYSAFKGTNLSTILRKENVARVVICGFMTNFCCESTAREAHDLDLYVTFVADATGCPDLDGLKQEEIRRLVSAFLEAGFATIVTTDAFLSGTKDRR